MIVHIDGDILKYRIGFAAEEEDEDTCLSLLRGYIADIMTAVDASDNIIHISGPTNYRYDVAVTKPYKGNRKDAVKPKWSNLIHKHLVDNYVTHVTEDEEADDSMGWMHMQTYEEDEYGSCIATVDKDLDMIPGLHYNFVKERAYYVDYEEADNFFLAQLLTGDTTDNIPGVPGVGPKKAAKLLAQCDSLADKYEAIFNAYQAAYDDARVAMLEQGRLLWIRRVANQMWELPRWLS